MLLMLQGESDFFVEYILPLLFSMIEAILTVLITLYVTKRIERQNSWISIRSELIELDHEIRKEILFLVDNPSGYNHNHFAFTFSRYVRLVKNMGDKVHGQKQRKNLETIWKTAERGYKDILLVPENEEVLNLSGKNDYYKFASFMQRVDSLLNNMEERVFY